MQEFIDKLITFKISKSKDQELEKLLTLFNREVFKNKSEMLREILDLGIKALQQKVK